MAGDDIAKNDISTILLLLRRKFEITDVSWQNNKNFEAKFRTQIARDNDDYNKLTDEWVDLFSEHTNTVWVKKASNTGPKVKFRKLYQCWTGEGRIVQKDLLFDPRRCKGTIDIKVLTDNPLTRRKNKYIRKGLNAVVKLNFYHLHEVDSQKSFSFFVHSCEPLPDYPKSKIVPNEKLPKLVEEMIQKGQITSQKAAERAEAKLKHLSNTTSTPSSSSMQVPQAETQILQNNSSNNFDILKMDLRPQYTQVVVNNTPQVNVNEQFLTCQPIMFDMGSLVPMSTESQFIYVTTPSLASQSHNYM